MTKLITVRVRSKDGMFRLDNINPDTTTLHQLKAMLENETGVPAQAQQISLSPQQQQSAGAAGATTTTTTLAKCGIKTHGQMVHMTYDTTQFKSKQDIELEKERKRKEAELGDGENIDNLGLRYRSKNWTLAQYLDLVNQHKIVIKHQKYSVTQRVSLDSMAAHNFQLFLRQIAFQRQRVGYLLGAITSCKRLQQTEEETASAAAATGGGDSQQQQQQQGQQQQQQQKPNDENENTDEHDYKEIFAAAIYEPPQSTEEQSTEFHELPAERENRAVDDVAALLGMERVGWVVSHDGTRDYPLSAKEILRAAELQAKYGDHFVTLTCFHNERGETEYEAFQVSKQCVELWSKGILKPHDTDPELVVTTKPVEIQRKRANEIEGLLLITNVAIAGYASTLRVGYPIENRGPIEFFPEYRRGRDVAKKYLLQDASKVKFYEKLSDFHFLLWLTDHLDVKSDFPIICAAVREQDDELCQNYKFLINSLVGIDQ